MVTESMIIEVVIVPNKIRVDIDAASILFLLISGSSIIMLMKTPNSSNIAITKTASPSCCGVR